MKVTAHNTYYIIRYNSRLSDKLPSGFFFVVVCHFPQADYRMFCLMWFGKSAPKINDLCRGSSLIPRTFIILTVYCISWCAIYLEKKLEKTCDDRQHDSYFLIFIFSWVFFCLKTCWKKVLKSQFSKGKIHKKTSNLYVMLELTRALSRAQLLVKRSLIKLYLIVCWLWKSTKGKLLLRDNFF